MAIPCRQCGREYDVTLFEFGRTIWCTCGSRVGLEPRVRELGPTAEKRFAADVMLGRLARWLRLLGFDCTYDPEIADADLARLGVSEQRIVLTRDRRFPEEWWIPNVHVVQEEEVRSQLVEVIRRFDLGASIRVLTRCSECNRALKAATRSDAVGRVPKRILALHEDFRECPGCGRVYWDGSHTVRIRKFAEGVAGSACASPNAPPRG